MHARGPAPHMHAEQQQKKPAEMSFFSLVAEDKPKWKERSVAASVPFMTISLYEIWLNVASTKHCCDPNDTN